MTVLMQTFNDAINVAWSMFKNEVVKTNKWQGMDVSKKPDMQMHEVLFYSFITHLPTEHLEHYAQDIKPNLPWADNHFLERVNGDPLNPGETWKSWPYAHSANGFRDENGQFNHNYMERYWPKYAGMTPDGILNYSEEAMGGPMGGLRHEYGDYNNLIGLLIKDPTTRQAYFPVWFPEDTGDVHMGRKPCTLGYHFIVRDGKLNVAYYIRSCDFLRHFRDDIYLTVRLLLDVLWRCRQADFETWGPIKPGFFVMHITSLHMFRNDFLLLSQRAGSS